MGVSAARNSGARSASAHFLAFLDADDEWLPGHLEVLRDLALDFPDADVVLARHCRKLNDHRIKQVVGLPPGFRGMVADFVDTYRRGCGLVHSSAVAIRPQAFSKCGGFPVGATRSQDIYLWLRLGLASRIAFDDSTTAIWHDDGSDAKRRSAVLPCHLERFLNPANETNYWKTPQLKRYLRKSLIINILVAKNHSQTELVQRLLHLSRRLERWFFAFAFAVSLIPRSVLRFGRNAQLYRRRLGLSGAQNKAN